MISNYFYFVAEKKKVTAEQEKMTIELAELQKYNSQVSEQFFLTHFFCLHHLLRSSLYINYHLYSSYIFMPCPYKNNCAVNMISIRFLQDNFCIVR